jgi:hypothetical protein
MGAKEALQKLADRKSLEIKELHLQLAQAEAYLRAIQDSIKVLPREKVESVEDFSLREGTAIAKARDILIAAGRPLHVLEILRRMGKQADKANRVSLSGSISAYARRKAIFKKTAPNTFGLIEVGRDDPPSPSPAPPKFPDEFGSVIDSSASLMDISPFRNRDMDKWDSVELKPSKFPGPLLTADAEGDIERVRKAVVSALTAAGHNTAAVLMEDGRWTLDGQSWRIDVNAKATMIRITFNAAAEREIRAALTKAGAATRFLIAPLAPKTIEIGPEPS